MQTLSVTPKYENIVYYYRLFVIINFQNHSIDSAAAAASTNMGRENVRNEINNEIEEEHAADIRDGRYHTHTHIHTHIHTYIHSLTQRIPNLRLSEDPSGSQISRHPSATRKVKKGHCSSIVCFYLLFCFFVSSFLLSPLKLKVD